MWVCWHFLPKCEADPKGTCTLTMLYENILWLNHTFTSPGVHCLDISIQNDISKLQTSFSLSVKPNSECMQEGALVCVCRGGLLVWFKKESNKYQQLPWWNNAWVSNDTCGSFCILWPVFVEFQTWSWCSTWRAGLWLLFLLSHLNI